jgi:hypothetical protein
VIDLSFTCTDVASVPHAAGPTLAFRLRIAAPEKVSVHAIALRCQMRIEPSRRTYRDSEAEALSDLFGERSRWGSSLLPIQFAHVSLMVPGFTGHVDVDLHVPCTYDLDQPATRYFEAVRDGAIPMRLLFSGTAFTGPRGFQVEPVPWDREAPADVPAEVWRRMLEEHFPGCGWLRLPRETMKALLGYRSSHALPSWEAAIEALLSQAAVPASRTSGVGGAAAAAASTATSAAGVTAQAWSVTDER